MPGNDECLTCPYLRVDAIPSGSGDGYGSSFESCDPPMGECPLDQPKATEVDALEKKHRKEV